MQKQAKKFKLSAADGAAYIFIILIMTVLLTATVLFSIDYSFVIIWNFIKNNVLIFVGLVGLILVILLTIFIYLGFSNKKFIIAKKNLVIIVIAVLITVLLEYPMEVYTPLYLVPSLLATALVMILISAQEAFVTNSFLTLIFLTIAILRGINGDFTIGATKLYFTKIITGAFSGYFIILILKNAGSRIKFVLYGFIVAMLVMPLAFTLSLFIGNSPIDSLYNALWALVGNMGCVVLFMFLLPLFESVFSISTTFKLNEYCNFNNALLKRLSEEAPGTFNHSLMVGNLAESCAIAIGENPQLARAAAYYHDVGKLLDPKYFSENQTGTNPHDDLIPEVSVKKIIKHTEYGYTLLKRYKYPEEIAEIALEHHGTSPVGYFYQKALNLTEGKINIANYSYSGPKPQTKIAAIIMICDAAEAASRAIRTAGVGAENLVGKLINEKIDYGQLDECPITMSELEIVKSTIFSVLSGIYHTRVDYNKKVK